MADEVRHRAVLGRPHLLGQVVGAGHSDRGLPTIGGELGTGSAGDIQLAHHRCRARWCHRTASGRCERHQQCCDCQATVHLQECDQRSVDNQGLVRQSGGRSCGPSPRTAECGTQRVTFGGVGLRCWVSAESKSPQPRIGSRVELCSGCCPRAEEHTHGGQGDHCTNEVSGCLHHGSTAHPVGVRKHHQLLVPPHHPQGHVVHSRTPPVREQHAGR